MKLDVKVSKFKTGIIHAQDMEIGQIGILRDDAAGTIPYYGKLVLKAYGVLLVLSDPKTTWTSFSSIEVELLPPGTVVTLTTQ